MQPDSIPSLTDGDDIDGLDDNSLHVGSLIHRMKRNSDNSDHHFNDRQNDNNGDDYGPRVEALTHPNVIKAWLKRIEVSHSLFILIVYLLLYFVLKLLFKNIYFV